MVWIFCVDMLEAFIPIVWCVVLLTQVVNQSQLVGVRDSASRLLG